jgi:uncharacterized membrane protein
MPLSETFIQKLKQSLNDSHKCSPVLFGVISSSLASIGLATNSQTTILGSMLLSPIGSLINKSNIYNILKANNVRLEGKFQYWLKPLSVVIVITLIISYIFGKIFSYMINPFTGEYVNKDWPTEEMKNRADPINAVYMIFIALLCGIALPMSILTNSGVRFVAIGIATALIPPLANIGISLSYTKHNKEKKEKEKEEKERTDFRKKAIITGLCIFIINVLLLWIPSRYLLEVFCKKNNVFKKIEKILNSW